MKTLTLFSAYVKAEKERETAWIEFAETPYPQNQRLALLARKRERQSKKLEHALTKRLQEQEEELERLRSEIGLSFR